MKKEFDELMLEYGEISELQECMIDVLENCMYKDKKPFYALSIMQLIRKRTDALYEEFDKFDMVRD